MIRASRMNSYEETTYPSVFHLVDERNVQVDSNDFSYVEFNVDVEIKVIRKKCSDRMEMIDG